MVPQGGSAYATNKTGGHLQYVHDDRVFVHPKCSQHKSQHQNRDDGGKHQSVHLHGLLNHALVLPVLCLRLDALVCNFLIVIQLAQCNVGLFDL